MTSEDKKKVEKLIERYKDEYFHHLCQLINFESTYGHELEAQLYLKKILEDLQMEIDIFEPDLDKLKEHSAYLSARQTFNGSPNLVGVWKGTGGGRSLLLNGHIDVVPAGDLKQWSQPPFMAINNGHSISGRGATDMKGGTISLLLALKVVQEMKVKLKGDVIFQSVIDEECGGAGTLAAILRGYQADAAVIPEPTKLKVFPLQQGSMWFRIKVTGRAAHGGTRYEGVSAIDKAIAVIEQLKKLETLRNERINHPLYQNIPIPIPINIGKMNGGDWPSSVPDEVMIEGRYGVSFDETMEEAKEEFERMLSSSMFMDSWFKDHPVSIEWFGARWMPGSITLEDPFLEQFKTSIKKISGKSARLEAAPWGTDAGLLSQVGDIPTVVYGPGTTELAHHPDEAIELEAIIEASKVFVDLILTWCEVE
ncbi:acetylornithine deacetylase [Alkalihalobacillus alcalophilus ATCC 27647 = CGMCC 1.3604]|uniref:Probable succinyl-diaminopimelate desuccinylase n=1 Tax=Alkalihalobacillus alcalophilus ATCC 27647 = CGMCC 1.3604 TaxID=1218173 RepID=A0A094YQ21_ALKAL|nr:peptidase [Alkalihalobacillus alcalophilus]KGA95577.1 acetylornithine deacetylase [Alkalihalobacillus alcalophilus ATCC 27647 = CGMCC 1.3604]MED1562042.1 peptidase [Alkalihalobacillus alcalophilus]THG88790.1 acetylornithine deacetylase [Alkalihalobacillus alcalophilus ATCC 27647 = CGMCC 1.3604]